MEINAFFSKRGVSNEYMLLFMRFLLMENAYLEFISDLTGFMHGTIFQNSDSGVNQSEWVRWSSKNLAGSERNILDSFLVWSITPHEQLWRKLNNRWRLFLMKNNNRKLPRSKEKEVLLREIKDLFKIKSNNGRHWYHVNEHHSTLIFYYAGEKFSLQNIIDAIDDDEEGFSGELVLTSTSLGMEDEYVFGSAKTIYLDDLDESVLERIKSLLEVWQPR